MNAARPTVAVLGASGLIGQAVAEALARDGCPLVAVARRFTPAQAAAFGRAAIVRPIADLEVAALSALLARADIVVNCLGVLQDSARGRTSDVHVALVARLLQALAGRQEPALLIHLSIPGDPADDATPFSRSKRVAEREIARSGLPHVILRPGFVVAPAAYGGSALVRALAATPFGLPSREGSRPFAATAMEDVTRTVTLLGRRWQAGERAWSEVWDVTERHPTTVDGVIDAVRRRFGGPAPLLRLPGWLTHLGGRAGDLLAPLGWTPPVRTTALREMMRGVTGDPRRWIAATGIEPLSLEEALARLPATVQERWFARLFLAKPLILAALAVFWIASGLIALGGGFAAAAAILMAHGVPPPLARAATLVTSLGDIAVGMAIACRGTCRRGLLAGIALSLAYMAGAALIAPDLWLDPLGALVKTAPAIVLMLVAVLILDDR